MLRKEKRSLLGNLWGEYDDNRQASNKDHELAEMLRKEKGTGGEVVHQKGRTYAQVASSPSSEERSSNLMRGISHSKDNFSWES